MRKNLDYWKREFGKLPDNRLLINARYFNTYDRIDSFAREDGLKSSEIEELYRFIVTEILKRKLKIPSGGFHDMVRIGYKLQKEGLSEGD